MKLHFSEINVMDRLVIFSNGQEVVDYMNQMFQLSDLKPGPLPITLLLLDINMPILNGLQTTARVRQIYDQVNQANR